MLKDIFVFAYSKHFFAYAIIITNCLNFHVITCMSGSLTLGNSLEPKQLSEPRLYTLFFLDVTVGFQKKVSLKPFWWFVKIEREC